MRFFIQKDKSLLEIQIDQQIYSKTTGMNHYFLLKLILYSKIVKKIIVKLNSPILRKRKIFS